MTTYGYLDVPLCEAKMYRTIAGVRQRVTCGAPAKYVIRYPLASANVCDLHRRVALRHSQRISPLFPVACYEISAEVKS